MNIRGTRVNPCPTRSLWPLGSSRIAGSGNASGRPRRYAKTGLGLTRRRGPPRVGLVNRFTRKTVLVANRLNILIHFRTELLPAQSQAPSQDPDGAAPNVGGHLVPTFGCAALGETLLPTKAEVYISPDWTERPATVPRVGGRLPRFDLDDYIDYFISHADELGPRHPCARRALPKPVRYRSWLARCR